MWICKKVVRFLSFLAVIEWKVFSESSGGGLNRKNSCSGDSSDGKILWVEVLNSTGTRNSENVESALFQCGGSSKTGDGNSHKGDGRTASGEGNFIETTALPVSVL